MISRGHFYAFFLPDRLHYFNKNMKVTAILFSGFADATTTVELFMLQLPLVMQRQ